jgi:hypothetical protein
MNPTSCIKAELKKTKNKMITLKKNNNLTFENLNVHFLQQYLILIIYYIPLMSVKLYK